MISFRTTIPLGAAIILAASTLVACDTSSLVTQYPGLAPIIGPRPTAKPFVLNRGSIRGIVVGASGDGQPIGRAFVTAGGANTFSADVKQDDVVEEETDENKDKDNLIVEHDFSEDEDGGTVQKAQRIIRKKTDLPAKDRYVYLKNGEFFLENLPEGIVQLKASFGNVESSTNPVTVYTNVIVQDVKLNLFIPEPLLKDGNGKVPPIVEWSGLKPPNGITLKVTENQSTTDTGTRVTFDVTYTPDPPDVGISLRSPPGSPGTVIGGYDVSLLFTNSKGAQTIGPQFVPLAPVLVPPAQEIAYGPAVVLTIPVGSTAIKDIYGQKKENGQPDPPGLILAEIKFKTPKGDDVIDSDLSAVKISVPLRAL